MRKTKAKELPKSVDVPLTDTHFQNAKCGDPNHCMVKVGAYAHFRDTLGWNVTHVRVKGNALVVTQRMPDDTSRTSYWAMPDREYNNIATFDELGTSIAAMPDKKLALLHAAGIRPHKFRATLIKSRIKHPTSPARQAAIEEARRKRVAYWARQEKKNPGVTPKGYRSGPRKRYASTALTPDNRRIKAAVASIINGDSVPV